MSIKLDMRKTYDVVEWIFFEKVMQKLGFLDNIVHLIMSCITSVSFKIFLNGISIDAI